MAQTFAEQFTLFDSTAFQQRLLMCLLKVANNVANEDPLTANHEKRAALAEFVIKETKIPFHMNLLLPVLNPALDVASPTDSDIEFTVVTFWEYFADRL